MGGPGGDCILRAGSLTAPIGAIRGVSSAVVELEAAEEYEDEDPRSSALTAPTALSGPLSVPAPAPAPVFAAAATTGLDGLALDSGSLPSPSPSCSNACTLFVLGHFPDPITAACPIESSLPDPDPDPDPDPAPELFKPVPTEFDAESESELESSFPRSLPLPL